MAVEVIEKIPDICVEAQLGGNLGLPTDSFIHKLSGRSFNGFTAAPNSLFYWDGEQKPTQMRRPDGMTVGWVPLYDSAKVTSLAKTLAQTRRQNCLICDQHTGHHCNGFKQAISERTIAYIPQVTK